MQVYDLSLSATKRNKLPGLSSWLNPNYPGSGVILVEKTAPSGAKYHNPKNWRKDFPDYTYQFDALQNIKKELNKVKQTIDPWKKDPKTARFYERLTDMVRFHDVLRGRRGILVQEFGAEIVTNAWLKMFELMMFVDPILDKLAKKRPSNDDDKRIFYSMHIAEAPGNFMLAINHYLRTNYPTLDWEWMANSYRDLYSSSLATKDQGGEFIGAARYLPDQYGLIKQYPKNWIFGADGDGDITSVANLRSFKQSVLSSGHDLQLLTSDVKYMPMDVNYDEEENINIPVHMGHLLCALMCLAPKGTMILKEFTFCDAPSVSLLYLMAHCFEQLLVVKPETSRPANSETYIVGIGYLANLSEVQMERLLNIMHYIQTLNTEDGSPSIFLKSDIAPEFLEKVVQLSKKTSEQQIKNITRTVELAKKYEGQSDARILEDMGAAREKAAREWIKKVKILPLEDKYHIASQPAPRDASQPASQNNRHPGKYQKRRDL